VCLVCCRWAEFSSACCDKNMPKASTQMEAWQEAQHFPGSNLYDNRRNSDPE
jgi:hypothetical protein